MDGVGVDVDCSASGHVVPAELIIGKGLAHGHGDGGDVPEGFAANVVQVGQMVRVEFRQAFGVVAGLGVEEEGVVLLDLRAQAGLDLRVGGEEVDGPGDAGGGGVVAGAEEGHDLITHGVEAEGVLAGGFLLHVVFDDEGDDVFVFGVRGFVFLGDYVRGFGDDDIAGFQHVAVHFHGEVLGDGHEGGEAVHHARGDVEGEDEAVGFADGGLRVLEGVEVGAKAGFANDVEGGAVEPFEDFDGHGASVLADHVPLPELREEEGFAPEDGGEGFDGLDGEAGGEGFALLFVWIAFGEEDALA